MKKLLLFFLVLGTMLSFEAAAQDKAAKPVKVKLGKTVLSVHPDALYVIKLEDRTVEMDQNVLDQLDQSWIVAAEALQGDKAMEDYGDKGEFGVVLVSFHKKFEPDVLRLIQDEKRRRM